MGLVDEAIADAARDNLPKRLAQLDKILRAKGIDLAELEAASVKDVKFWQSMHKDNDGEAIVTDLAGITFSPAWETGPAWPVVQPGPKVPLHKPAKARIGKGYQRFMSLPDMQVGYFWRDGELIPTHDEEALAIVLAMVTDYDPDVIVLHGDNADFPELGRYRLTPSFAQTTQATVDRLTLLAGELREAAPRAGIKWLAGNHEERLSNYVIDNAKAAFGLRKGMDPDGWPVLSVPYLCRLDDVGIDYLPGYPANRYDINDGLRVIHGDKTGPAGTVAAKYLHRSHRSVMFGHIHTHDEAEVTNEDGWQVWAGSAGCLCRVDGAVPSTHSGSDLDGVPVQVHESWQQGLFVGEFKPDSRAFSVEHVSIRHSWSRWRGREYGKAA